MAMDCCPGAGLRGHDPAVSWVVISQGHSGRVSSVEGLQSVGILSGHWAKPLLAGWLGAERHSAGVSWVDTSWEHTNWEARS